MEGTFRGRGAKGLQEYLHLPELHKLKENRYRKELFLVKGEEIITIEFVEDEVHAKTNIGEILLTSDGRLVEDGICFETGEEYDDKDN